MTTTENNYHNLLDDWIAGFVDGDGCFSILRDTDKSKVRHRFIVSQDKSSVDVLYAFKKRFGCGTVQKQGGNMMCYQVGDRKSLQEIVVPFFLNNPLQTRKRHDFYFFAVSLTSTEKNVSLSFAKGNNEFLAKREAQLKKIEEDFVFSITSGWFAGFLDADGSFVISIVKGYPRPQMLIGTIQENRDTLEALQRFLGAGTLRSRKDGFVIFQVASVVQFHQNVFPHLFFGENKEDTEENSVLQEKLVSLSFSDCCCALATKKRFSAIFFKNVVEMILRKEHKTEIGLKKIYSLKQKLNKQIL